MPWVNPTGFRLQRRNALVADRLDIHLMWQQAQSRSAAPAKYAIKGETTRWAEIQKAADALGER